MDDSRLQFGYQICSLVLVVRGRSIQKYPIFGSFRSDEKRYFSLARGYLTNSVVLESSSVFCCIAYKNKLRL